MTTSRTYQDLISCKSEVTKSSNKTIKWILNRVITPLIRIDQVSSMTSLHFLDNMRTWHLCQPSLSAPHSKEIFKGEIKENDLYYCFELQLTPFILIGPGNICHIIGWRQVQLPQQRVECSQMFNHLQIGLVIVCFDLSFMSLLGP